MSLQAIPIQRIHGTGIAPGRAAAVNKPRLFHREPLLYAHAGHIRILCEHSPMTNTPSVKTTEGRGSMQTNTLHLRIQSMTNVERVKEKSLYSH